MEFSFVRQFIELCPDYLKAIWRTLVSDVIQALQLFRIHLALFYFLSELRMFRRFSRLASVICCFHDFNEGDKLFSTNGNFINV